jgi:hypothetical protein
LRPNFSTAAGTCPLSNCCPIEVEKEEQKINNDVKIQYRI